jgi:hypothetical protein
VVEALLIAHSVVLLTLFRLLHNQVGRIIALVFLVYMLAFTMLKPAMMFYLDLYLPYSTNDESAIAAMLVGSLMFLVIQYVVIKGLTNHRPSRVVLQFFDFSRAQPRSIWLTFVCFMAISFIGSTIKFGDAGYLFSSANTFDASTEQANGSYYIVIVAESLFFGAIAVMAFYSSRLPLLRSFVLLIGVLIITYFWAKIASRTGMLVMLITWLACSLSIHRQRRLNVLYIALFGYILLILLYVGNLVRLGNFDAVDPAKAAFGAIVAASADLGPVDDAALLYSEMNRHQNTNFVQLIGAITPMVLIPSSIFPLKIPADKDTELNRIFFPSGADTTFYHQGSILTFTVPGSGYADAGYFGTAVSSVVYALIFSFYLRIIRRGSPSAKFVAVMFLVVHIVGYRLSVEALLQTFYIALLFIGLAKWLAVLMFARRATTHLRETRSI